MKLTIYATSILDRLKREKRKGTAKTYRTALRKALEFGGEDVSLATVFTCEWLTGYEEWLMRKGYAQNSISSYMRMLKRCHSLAVRQGLIEDTPQLFSHVFTGYDSTPKRALVLVIINLIRGADLSFDKRLEFCRDLFMLSFYLHGISFVDLAYLRKCDMKNGVIVYRRKKSRSPIIVPIHPKAKAIIQRYVHLTKDIPYLLPIIVDKNKDERTQYESALRRQNRHLKLVAKELHIKENLTSYVARHSWATAAYHEKVSTTVISQAMGHQSEKITMRYLAEFDYSELEKANLAVIKALEKLTEEDKKENVRNYDSCGHEVKKPLYKRNTETNKLITSNN